MTDNRWEFWPGPMEGLMTAPFLLAAGELGLTGRWMTPFLRIGETAMKEKHLREFLKPFAATGLPTAVQLMGTDAAAIAESAGRLLDSGVREINLNFGCPSRQVTSGNAGGGAWKTPDLLLEILRQTRSAVGERGKLTAKIRSGWSNPDEMLRILPRLDFLDGLYFHYRTVKEQYCETAPGTREARMESLLQVYPNPGNVVWNGDINDVSTARRLLETYGGKGVMAARYWLRDPYLLRRMENPEQNFPPPEKIRRQWYERVLELAPDFPLGKRMELSNQLWGGKANNPHFEELVSLMRSSRL